ncbi:3D domain-containing protein [Desulfovibrio inopinatus]|uniref:3D domain-containing protein n=1 Tax=Desulfovibrio inopinatus TaxID=102109 RepID=UPI0003F54E6D|nr:3D domain-containing protein [Desulfovibrio inopinatus]
MAKTVNIILLAVVCGLLYFGNDTLSNMKAELNDLKDRNTALETALFKQHDINVLLQKVVLAARGEKASTKPIPTKKLTVTAYSPRPQETDDTPGITASNTRVREGIVAVSRDLFRQGWVFGKKVYIKNHGVFTISDLMNKRKQKSMDIFMHNTNKALEFGRRKLEVILLDV